MMNQCKLRCNSILDEHYHFHTPIIQVSGNSNKHTRKNSHSLPIILHCCHPQNGKPCLPTPCQSHLSVPYPLSHIHTLQNPSQSPMPRGKDSPPTYSCGHAATTITPRRHRPYSCLACFHAANLRREEPVRDRFLAARHDLQTEITRRKGLDPDEKRKCALALPDLAYSVLTMGGWDSLTRCKRQAEDGGEGSAGEEREGVGEIGGEV